VPRTPIKQHQTLAVFIVAATPDLGYLCAAAKELNLRLGGVGVERPKGELT
jgi:hypothetical protein